MGLFVVLNEGEGYGSTPAVPRPPTFASGSVLLQFDETLDFSVVYIISA